MLKIRPRSFSVLVLAFVLCSGAAVSAQESAPVDSDLPVLSLEDCVRLSLEDSPTLNVSEEQRLIAEQGVKGAYGNFLPDLSIGHNWQRSERTDFDVENTDPAMVGVPVVDAGGIPVLDYQVQFPTSIPNGTFGDQTIITTYKDINGRVNLNLFRGMQKFAALGSRKAELRAADASVGYTRELVVEEVSNAYFNLLRYQKLLEVAIEARDRAAKELERTDTYFRLGSAAKSDVLQQRVNLENRRLDVVVADNTVKKAFADLAFAMNRPMAAAFNVDTSVLDTDYYVEDVNDLYREALAARLDLESREHTVDARQNDVTAASSNLWPSLDAFASHNRYSNDSPFRFGSQRSSSTTVGYSVSWNIFDRLQVWTNRSQAKANARIADYQLDQARMNVQVEIRQLHNQLVEAKERAQVSRETIEQSLEELRLAQERFRVGAGTTLDVLVAQSNLANSQANEVAAMCDFLIAETMMNRAVGRLVAPEPEQE